MKRAAVLLKASEHRLHEGDRLTEGVKGTAATNWRQPLMQAVDLDLAFPKAMASTLTRNSNLYLDVEWWLTGGNSHEFQTGDKGLHHSPAGTP